MRNGVARIGTPPQARLGIVITILLLAAACTSDSGDEVTAGQQPSEDTATPSVELSSTEWRPLPTPVEFDGFSGSYAVALPTEAQLLVVGGGKPVGGDKWEPTRAVSVLSIEALSWSDLPPLPGNGAVGGLSGAHTTSQTVLVGFDCPTGLGDRLDCRRDKPLSPAIWSLGDGENAWERHEVPEEVAKRFERPHPMLAGVLGDVLVLAINDPSSDVLSGGYWELHLVDPRTWEWKQITTPVGLYQGHQLCVTDGELHLVGVSLAAVDENTSANEVLGVALQTYVEVEGKWHAGPSFTPDEAVYSGQVVCAEGGIYAQQNYGQDSWWYLPLGSQSWQRLPTISDSEDLDTSTWNPAPAGDRLVAMNSLGSGLPVAVAVYDPAVKAWTRLPDAPPLTWGSPFPVYVDPVLVDESPLLAPDGKDLEAIIAE